MFSYTTFRKAIPGAQIASGRRQRNRSLGMLVLAIVVCAAFFAVLGAVSVNVSSRRSVGRRCLGVALGMAFAQAATIPSVFLMIASYGLLLPLVPFALTVVPYAVANSQS